MTASLSPADRAKAATARKAAELVETGMQVGLGTGSTAAFLVDRLGERVRDEGLRFRGVPTSRRTADQARDLGIEIVTLEEAGRLDLTIDGTDEFDPDLTLIKGGGGAHLREKIVAAASDRMVVIADAGKEVGTLGAFPLPVEVIPFGWTSTQMLISSMLAKQDVAGHDVVQRQAAGAGTPFTTDEGNYILDLHLGRIGSAETLSRALNQIPGVVDNGLFIGYCDAVILGFEDGHVEERRAAGKDRAMRTGHEGTGQ